MHEQEPTLAELFFAIESLKRELVQLSGQFTVLADTLGSTGTAKEWYTTGDVAEAKRVSQYTVQEKWCRQRRIEAEKDPDTGK